MPQKGAELTAFSSAGADGQGLEARESPHFLYSRRPMPVSDKSRHLGLCNFRFLKCEPGGALGMI